MSNKRFSRWIRWSTAVAGALLVTIALVTVTASAVEPAQQERRRLKQLEVFEELLTETVQEYVSDYMNTTIMVAGGAGESQAVVVKVGMAASAHGMYIDGYGVIFSIQTPQVSVIPRSLEVRFAEPFSVLRIEPEGGRSQRRVTLNVIDFRTNMIRQQLRELQTLLARELAEGVETEVSDARLEQIEQMRLGLAEITRLEAEANPDDQLTEVVEEEAETEATESKVHEARGLHTIDDYYRSVVREQRTMKERLARNAAEVEGSVNEAAIETLASYGGVIKGLDNDDRISVLVFPPSRLAFSTRQGVTPQREEYVISVRYKDVRDLDNQKIDFAEFRDRVNIHSRLGIEIKLEIKEEQ